MSASPRSVPPDDPRLSYALDRLRPTRRGREACRRLGITTVGDYLRTPREAFVEQAGCGPATVDALDKRVQRFLEQAGPATTGFRTTLSESIDAVAGSPRIAAALRALGVETLGALLALPRRTLLDAEGIGERSYEDVTVAVRDRLANAPLDATLLPHRLSTLPVDRLALSAALQTTLREAGITTVGELLTDRTLLVRIGAAGHAEVHDALDRLLAAAIDGDRSQPATFGELFGRLVASLDWESTELLRERLGLGCPPLRAAEIAARRQLREEELRRRLRRARQTVQKRAGALLRQLRDEAEHELDAGEGVVLGDRLTPGSLLAAAADEAADCGIPLRLLRFFFPRELYLHDGALTRTPPTKQRALRRALRGLVRPLLLPMPLRTLQQLLPENVADVERGVLLYELRHHLRLSVFLDPEGDELVERRPDPVADQVHEVLAHTPAPMFLEEVLGEYRARHGTLATGRLLQCLRRDPRFVEIGSELWSLRERHRAQIEGLQPEVKRVARRLRQAGRRRRVRELLAKTATPRTVHLVIDCLRRDPGLRDLGRGEFCARDQEHSAVVRDLARDLKRAMGELPIGRFLRNQPPERRQLVERLLRNNRLFVEPGDDRVDLITNYPFDQRRLRALIHLVEGHLRRRNGYATCEELAELAQATPLGGDFLTPHLLGDLLRRHGPFEMLPGGVVALPNLELGGWIQRKARHALRHSGMPMTLPEILLEAPELAEFSRCLAALLKEDPMVVASDAEHWQMA